MVWNLLKRSRKSNHYKDSNNPIKRKSMIHTSPINYFDGNWKPIDTTPTSSDNPDYDYEMTEADYQAFFPKITEAPIKFMVGDVIGQKGSDHYFNHDIQDASFWDEEGNDDYLASPELIAGQVLNNPDRIKYLGVYDVTNELEADLEYRLIGIGLKENLILKTKPRDPAGYLVGEIKFGFAEVIEHPTTDMWVGGVKITPAVQPFTTTKGIEFRDSGGAIKFQLPPPYAWDNNGDAVACEYEIKKIGQAVYLTVLTPWAWLETASYPVRIDPSPAVIFIGYDVGVYFTAPVTYSFYSVTATTIPIGINGLTTSRAGLDFDISSISDDVTITQVQIVLYVNSTDGGDEIDMDELVATAASYVGMSNPSGLYADADGNSYLSASTVFQTTGAQLATLSASAVSDLQAALTTTNSFNVGVSATGDDSGEMIFRSMEYDALSDASIVVYYDEAVELVGSLAGQSALTGIKMETTMELKNTGIDGSAGLTNDLLSLTMKLTGSLDGAGGLSAVLQRIKFLAGSSDGQSALTNNLMSLTMEVAGLSDGLSSLAGIVKFDASRLIGSIDASATILDDLLSTTMKLVGDIDGASTADGVLVTGKLLFGSLDAVSNLPDILLEIPSMKLSGQIDGATGLSGALEMTMKLIGQSDGVAGLTNNLLSLTMKLNGSLDALSTLDGVLTTQGLVALVGQIDALSNIVIPNLELSMKLIGDIDGQANLPATLLKIPIMELISVEITGQSSLIGVLGKSILLIGTIDAISVFEDSSLKLIMNLAGQIDGTSFFTVQIPNFRVTMKLNGTTDGLSGLTDNLMSTIMRLIYDFGVPQITGQSSLSAILTRLRVVELIGTSDAISSMDLVLMSMTMKLDPSPIVATSTLDGVLAIQGIVNLIGTCDALSSLGGSLKVAMNLTGALSAISNLWGVLFVTLPLDERHKATVELYLNNERIYTWNSITINAKKNQLRDVSLRIGNPFGKWTRRFTQWQDIEVKISWGGTPKRYFVGEIDNISETLSKYRGDTIVIHGRDKGLVLQKEKTVDNGFEPYPQVSSTLVLDIMKYINGQLSSPLELVGVSGGSDVLMDYEFNDDDTSLELMMRMAEYGGYNWRIDADGKLLIYPPTALESDNCLKAFIVGDRSDFSLPVNKVDQISGYTFGEDWQRVYSVLKLVGKDASVVRSDVTSMLLNGRIEEKVEDNGLLTSKIEAAALNMLNAHKDGIKTMGFKARGDPLLYTGAVVYLDDLKFRLNKEEDKYYEIVGLTDNITERGWIQDINVGFEQEKFSDYLAV